MNIEIENNSAVVSQCGTYRYALCRVWNTDKPLLLFIMLNPSIADHYINDPTIRRCMKFAFTWGYGGILVGNLFAFRSTDPKMLRIEAEKGNDIVGPYNDEALASMKQICKDTVFAWGTNGTLKNRDLQVMQLFDSAKLLGITKDGHPKHPLYVKQSQRPIDTKIKHCGR